MKLFNTLNELIPFGKIGSGIFKNMPNNLWGDLITSDMLDIDFFSLYGDCFTSPLTEAFANENGFIEDENLIKLANYLYNKHLKEWNHLITVLQSEYNPIHNYDRTETTTETNTQESNNTIVYNNNTITTRTGKDTTRNNVNITDTGTGTNTVESNNNVIDKKYAYDSVSASPDTEQTSSNSGNTTANSTNTRVDTSTYEYEKNTNDDVGKTGTDTTTLTNNETRTISTNVGGNIGVTTTQQMLESEVEFWKWNFFNRIFEDVKKEICLDIF